MRLHSQQNEIKEIVTRHVELKNSQTCRLGEFTEWILGSFNVCIPIYISTIRINAQGIMSSSDSRYPTKWENLSIQGMWMRRSDVRPPPSFGSAGIVPTSLSPSFGSPDLQVALM